MDGLKPGRIVYYVLSETDVAEITRRRTTSQSIADRIGEGRWPVGAQAHIGNEVKAGDVRPAMVLQVWSQESGQSNLKCMLDGADEYWATSRLFDGQGSVGTWHWMFEGQATRYDVTVPH